MRVPHLKKLFSPRSIAIIGASQTPGKAGHEMLKALCDFTGDIFPVNPGANEILGYPVYERLSDINGSIDLVIITLPAKYCLDAVREAAQINAGALMIISGGFAETGERGQKRQQKIQEICQKSNICLLGPNTSGFANPMAKLAACFAPGVSELKPGPLAIISQSGATNLTISSLAVAHDLGVSLAVGTGNGLNISPADIINYLADDDNTRVIIVYLEGVNDGRKLFEAIQTTVPRKPVIIYTVGKADIGDFAASHTGNLMGSYVLKKSALTQAGAILVDSVEEMIDAAQIFCCLRLEPKPDPGVGLLTGQAGPGMIISDYLRDNNISMPELSNATIKDIGNMLPPMTYMKNPVDTGRPGDNFSEILNVIARDAAIDVLLTFAIHEPAAVDPVKMFKQAISTITKPIIFGTAGIPGSLSPAITALKNIKIPAFPTPDRTARAVRYLVEDAKSVFRCQNNTTPRAYPAQQMNLGTKPTEEDAKKLISTIGITSPQNMVCDNHDQAMVAFDKIQKPCVVKVMSSEITHKTEVGGVYLNIDSPEKLLSALKAIDNINCKGHIRYLVETMAPQGLEMILGGTRDKSFGPTVLIGLGGTQAEALGDISIRIAPLDIQDAAEMLKELRSYDLLNGWRGQPALNKPALEQALVALSHLLLCYPEILEIDINPLRIYPERILALDALIVTRKEQTD